MPKRFEKCSKLENLVGVGELTYGTGDIVQINKEPCCLIIFLLKCLLLFVCVRAMAGWKDGGPGAATVGGRASAHGTVPL